MVPYDASCLDYANSTLDILSCANSMSGGVFFGGVYVALFIILVLALQSRNPLPEAFLASGVALATLTMLMWGLGISSVGWFVASLLIIVLSAVANWKDRGG